MAETTFNDQKHFRDSLLGEVDVTGGLGQSNKGSLSNIMLSVLVILKLLKLPNLIRLDRRLSWL